MAVNVTKTLSERIRAHEAPIMKRKFPQFALFQGDSKHVLVNIIIFLRR